MENSLKKPVFLLWLSHKSETNKQKKLIREMISVPTSKESLKIFLR